MSNNPKGVRLVYTGVRNLFLRIITAPLSFIFTYLVAKYLSSLPNGEVVFASWQSLYVLVLGYFTIPADMFSLLTSRYASENKPVGGIIFINLISGGASTLIYIFTVPFLVHSLSYNNFFDFYIASVMIFVFYIYRIILAIARGRTPLVIGVSTVIFQIVRLVAVIIAFFVFHLSIDGVIYAYVLGYISQTLINLLFIKANLTFDIKVALATVKKSIVTIISYLQLIIEATIVWASIIILHNAIPIAYFESAMIISNVVTWSYSLYDGLIAKLSETKDPSIISTSLNLYFLLSTLWLAVVISEGHALLYHIRREYLLAIFPLIILSVSNYLRGIYFIFYYAIVMKDKSLGIDELENPFKGVTAKLNITNIVFSFVGVTVSTILVYLLRNYPPYVIATGMTVGLIIDSLWLVRSSYKIAKEEYNFSVSRRGMIASLLDLAVVSAIFYWINFVSYISMVIYGLASALLYILINYAFNPYARVFVRSTLREIRKFLM